MKIHNRLRELRLEAHLKQSDLAKIIGCGQQKISSYERSEYLSAEIEFEEALANYFGCSIDYLRGISSIKNPEDYIEKSILLKDEFVKLGILKEDQDLSDELLTFFRDLVKANKPFFKQLSELKESNNIIDEDNPEKSK